MDDTGGDTVTTPRRGSATAIHNLTVRRMPDPRFCSTHASPVTAQEARDV